MSFDFFIVYLFIIGLLIGSFLNVCVYRIPREESIAFPPSHCTSCNTRLKSLDLVPVLSYLFLGRKCRYCGEKISSRYALVELFTGIVYAALYVKFGMSFELFKFAVLAALLITIGLIDYDTTDVYFIITLSGIICGVLFIAAGYFMDYPVLTYIYGGLFSGGILAAIIFFTKGMGWGDFEICLLSGLYLGFSKSIVMLFFSFVLGGIIGILLIATKKKSRKDYIPFGPYIVLGTLIAVLFGDGIIKWYMPF